MPICTNQLGCCICRGQFDEIACKAYSHGGLNVSQQNTFMPQTLDYGGKHHHMARKASEAPLLKTIIPQKTAIHLGEVHHV